MYAYISSRRCMEPRVPQAIIIASYHHWPLPPIHFTHLTPDSCLTLHISFNPRSLQPSFYRSIRSRPLIDVPAVSCARQTATYIIRHEPPSNPNPGQLSTTVLSPSLIARSSSTPSVLLLPPSTCRPGISSLRRTLLQTRMGRRRLAWTVMTRRKSISRAWWMGRP